MAPPELYGASELRAPIPVTLRAFGDLAAEAAAPGMITRLMEVGRQAGGFGDLCDLPAQ